MLPTQAQQFLFKDKESDGYAVVNSNGKKPMVNLDQGMSYQFIKELPEQMNIGDKLYFDKNGNFSKVVRNPLVKKKTTTEGSGCVVRKIYI